MASANRRVLGMPETEDENMYAYPSREQQAQLRDYQVQLQLVTGWIDFRSNRLRYEIEAAGDSSNIDVNARFFKVPSETLGPLHKLQYERWLHFLQVDNLGKKGPDGFYRVSLFDCCTHVVRVAEKKCATRQALLIIPVLSLLNVAIAVFLSDQDFNNISALGIVYNVTASFLSLFYFAVLELFMFIAFLDYYRRYHYAMLLSRLARVLDAETRVCVTTSRKKHLRSLKVRGNSKNSVRHFTKSTYFCAQSFEESETTSPTGESCPFARDTALTTEEKNLKALEDSEHNIDISTSVEPKIDLLIPSNYIAWLNCKQVFLRFGKRTEFRLRIYLGKKYTN
jgi:hypothetical protein